MALIPTKEWGSLTNLGFPAYECHKSALVRRIGKNKLIGHEDAKSHYPIVQLRYADGQKKDIKLDIIICTIFHGNPPNNNSEVIHIDNNRLNSNADNLKWGTPNEKLHCERAQFRSENYINGLTLEGEQWRDGTPYGYSGYSEVIHIDNNHLNSNADNLKWGTPNEKLHCERAQFRSENYINALTLEGEQWRDGTPYGYSGYRA